MDIPVVLSHRTAWLYHNAMRAHEPTSPACVIEHAAPIVCDDGVHDEFTAAPELPNIGLGQPRLSTRSIISRIAEYLKSLGIPANELDRIDVLCSFEHERSGSKLVRRHVFGAMIPTEHLVPIAKNLFVVDEVMCFVQAGSWMSELEQLEYGYEICAGYHLNHLNADDYVAIKPRYRADHIGDYCARFAGHRGVRRVRRLLRHIKNDARSPMETAMALAVTCRRSQGGLGYCRFELNQQIEIPETCTHLTRASFYEADMLVPAVRLIVEYNGSDHREKAQSASDAERAAALTAMGYRVVVLTGTQCANQLQFHRAMNNIATLLGIACDRSEEYQLRQNELRMFLIRNWGGLDARGAEHL